MTWKSCACSLRYSIHLWDLKHPGTWEGKGTYVYYTDFIMELAMLFLDLVHHIHMLVRDRENMWSQCDFYENLANQLSWSLILFPHMSLISSLVTSGCLWQAWLSSCSCGTSSTRSSAVCAVTKTTSVSSTTWRPGHYIFYLKCFFPLLLGDFVMFFLMELLLIWYDFCRFAVATAEELAANDDDCAICWDAMSTARKLPCGHLFHK